jgi:hypothetical protein
MKRFVVAAACGAAVFGVAQDARAHGVAGDHLFVSTLLIDDSNVSDEMSLPTFSFQPQPSDTNPAPGLYAVGFEFDKRITENFGFSINSGYNWLTQPGNKTANGWSNIVVTLKDKVYVNDKHEFMLSVGVQREFGRSGANGSNGAVLDNDDVGSTEPTIYASKGFGDIPVPFLRPLAITGELGYAITDKKLKLDGMGNPLNNGGANGWEGGLSLQYSLRYLSTQVKDYGFPEWLNRVTPLVELAWTSPASKPSGGQPTTYLWGVGVNYTATDYAVGLEALIPGNKNTGSHVGFIAQFHLYFDDMFPHSLGAPIASWF